MEGVWRDRQRDLEVELLHNGDGGGDDDDDDEDN